MQGHLPKFGDTSRATKEKLQRPHEGEDALHCFLCAFLIPFPIARSWANPKLDCGG